MLRLSHRVQVLFMPRVSMSRGCGLCPARLRCEKCSRSGQYRIDKLIERYGPDIALPDLRHELAQCPRRRDMSDPCQVQYVDRLG
jgi:hypothetical protein